MTSMLRSQETVSSSNAASRVSLALLATSLPFAVTVTVNTGEPLLGALLFPGCWYRRCHCALKLTNRAWKKGSSLAVRPGTRCCRHKWLR